MEKFFCHRKGVHTCSLKRIHVNEREEALVRDLINREVEEGKKQERMDLMKMSARDLLNFHAGYNTPS